MSHSMTTSLDCIQCDYFDDSNLYGRPRDPKWSALCTADLIAVYHPNVRKLDDQHPSPGDFFHMVYWGNSNKQKSRTAVLVNKKYSNSSFVTLFKWSDGILIDFHHYDGSSTLIVSLVGRYWDLGPSGMDRVAQELESYKGESIIVLVNNRNMYSFKSPKYSELVKVFDQLGLHRTESKDIERLHCYNSLPCPTFGQIDSSGTILVRAEIISPIFLPIQVTVDLNPESRSRVMEKIDDGVARLPTNVDLDAYAMKLANHVVEGCHDHITVKRSVMPIGEAYMDVELENQRHKVQACFVGLGDQISHWLKEETKGEYRKHLRRYTHNVFLEPRESGRDSPGDEESETRSEFTKHHLDVSDIRPQPPQREDKPIYVAAAEIRNALATLIEPFLSTSGLIPLPITLFKLQLEHHPAVNEWAKFWLGSFASFVGRCYATSHFPEPLKNPTQYIRKWSSRLEPAKEYLLVSILTSFSEVIEFLMAERLQYMFATQPALLPRTMYTGRQGIEAEVPLHQLEVGIYQASEQGLEAAVLSLGAVQDYECIQHVRLVDTMISRRVDHSLIRWIENFLTRGRFATYEESRWCGIPDHSPLTGPLFSLYYAPFVESLATVGLPIVCADTTTLVLLSGCEEELDDKIDKILLRYGSFRPGGLSFHQEKMTLTQFGETVVERELPNYKHGRQATNIGWFDNVSAMHVTLDAKLEFSDHVECFLDKASWQAWKLKSLRDSGLPFTSEEIQQACVSHVRGPFHHAILLWALREKAAEAAQNRPLGENITQWEVHGPREELCPSYLDKKEAMKQLAKSPAGRALFSVLIEPGCATPLSLFLKALKLGERTKYLEMDVPAFSFRPDGDYQIDIVVASTPRQAMGIHKQATQSEGHQIYTGRSVTNGEMKIAACPPRSKKERSLILGPESEMPPYDAEAASLVLALDVATTMAKDGQRVFIYNSHKPTCLALQRSRPSRPSRMLEAFYRALDQIPQRVRRNITVIWVPDDKSPHYKQVRILADSAVEPPLARSDVTPMEESRLPLRQRYLSRVAMDRSRTMWRAVWEPRPSAPNVDSAQTTGSNSQPASAIQNTASGNGERTDSRRKNGRARNEETMVPYATPSSSAESRDESPVSTPATTPRKRSPSHASSSSKPKRAKRTNQLIESLGQDPSSPIVLDD